MSGVLMRKAKRKYVTAPEAINPQVLEAVTRINAAYAFTMRSDVLDGILAEQPPGLSNLMLADGSQLQILESITSITSANVKKFQYACILREECLILVWHDDLDLLLPHATRLEEKLLALVGTPEQSREQPVSPIISFFIANLAGASK